MSELPGVVVVEWGAWDGFLLPTFYPTARRLPVDLGTRALALVERLAAGDKVLIYHVNLTFLDRGLMGRETLAQALGERSIRTLNLDINSIDKWAVQKACVSAGIPTCKAPELGQEDELLVVKSRANHAGRGERYAAPYFRAGLEFGFPPGDRIKVLPRAAVPSAAWSDPTLTIERFIDNPEGRFHRAYVLGQRIAVVSSQSTATLKEMWQRDGVMFQAWNGPDADGPPLSDVLSTSAAIAREMRLGYGAIDLMEDVEGRLYPVDVNVTPYWGKDENPELLDFLKNALLAVAGKATATI